MLHLIQSNKMESLADSLIDCLGRQACDSTSLFSADTILVQSPGMSQWLKIQIAEKSGIAANLDFPLPATFIWELYRQNIANLPEQSAFTKANMTWKLMALLPKMLAQSEFSAIRDYLHDAPMLKCYQLAHKIADIYDQYLVYRPEWILAWENNATLEGNAIDNKSGPDESLHPWQGILWRALRDYSQELGESVYHRANLHNLLIEQLQNQPNDPATNLKPLYVFGLSAIPLQQLEVLNALAAQREVLIFWFNPSQHYWGDIVDGKTMARATLQQLLQSDEQNPDDNYLQTGNPLLASWGKLGRDYQDMLLAFDLQQHDRFVESAPQNMLQHIQSEIFQLQFRYSFDALSPVELLGNGEQFPKTEVALHDHSVQFHACHTRVRELEVLHDQLLQWFACHPDSHPGDVIVMMPDVAAYAPFIEGVFGSPASGHFIPYGISDRKLSEESPLLLSFVQLMKLEQSRLSLSEVMTWLAVPAIMRKFAISEAEYNLLQHWLADAGVRWGWDEDDKSRWDLPQQGQNTWLFGLQRLLAGYAMDSEQLFAYQDRHISPYSDIEGQQVVALGKFYLFSQQLLAVMTFCQSSATLADKVTQALLLLDNLYASDEQELNDINSLRAALEQISQHSEQCQQPIAQGVFVAELEQQLSEKGVGQRFLAGYVNFCTLMPMRSIPFKVICILGMNDADYPRQAVPVGFDLMRYSAAKRGDRSRRLDDRYLFLEAMLSARELLYISYLGRSHKDNSELSPSILLSELLEYCEQAYVLQDQLGLTPEQSSHNLRQHLLIEHPLQPFSPEYFNAQPRFPSFNQRALHLAVAQQQPWQNQRFEQESLPELYAIDGHKLQLDGLDVVIGLDELLQFFINPAKAFFMQRWQCRFSFLGDELQDDEPFSFDGLDKFQLNERLMSTLIQHLQHNNDTSSLLTQLSEQLRAEGKLPVGYSGDLALANLAEQSLVLASTVLEHSKGQSATVSSIELALSCEYQGQTVQVALSGQVPDVYGNKLILWRSGKMRAKDRLQLYIQWLALCAQGTNAQGANPQLDEAVFVELDKKAVKDWCLTPLKPEEARSRLAELLELFILGQQQPLHFYPESAWQWLKTGDQQATLKTFEGQEGDFSFPENAEAHIRRVCPDLRLVFESFSHLSEQIMQPLIDLSKA